MSVYRMLSSLTYRGCQYIEDFVITSAAGPITEGDAMVLPVGWAFTCIHSENTCVCVHVGATVVSVYFGSLRQFWPGFGLVLARD